MTGHPIVTTVRCMKGTESLVLSRSGQTPTHYDYQLPHSPGRFCERLTGWACGNASVLAVKWILEIGHTLLMSCSYLWSFRLLILFHQEKGSHTEKRKMGSTNLQLCGLTWLIPCLVFYCKWTNLRDAVVLCLCITFPDTAAILKQRFIDINMNSTEFIGVSLPG